MSSASTSDSAGKPEQHGSDGIVSFSEMEYVRPDMEEYQRLVDAVCETAKVTRTEDPLVDRILDVYDYYDYFYTMQSLADIRYSLDLRDTYYQEEYQYCSEQSAVIEQGLDTCYMAMAQSAVVAELENDEYFGPGFFDSYQGDSVWTEELVGLMTRESTLVAESYSIMNELNEEEYYSDAYFETGIQSMGELLVELVKLRQEIAACLGYDSYGDFAFEYYYGRDYTPEEADRYLQRIQEKLVPLYCAPNESDFWYAAYWDTASPESCRRYLKETTDAMGGRLQSAYSLMVEKELYDLTASPYKYQGSFEVYLTSYSVPFVFLNTMGDSSDYLTFTHEFGHFANDYFCGGSYATTDVAEVFSQGLEYLSLCYGPEDVTDMEALRQMKLADSLNTYVEQAAYARFEDVIYALSEEELTVENLSRIYEQIGVEYGFDTWNWDSRDWITIPHFFTSPYYILSYVVSNDAAMQLYEMELEKPGAGLALYEEYVGGCPDAFMAFIEEAGLDSPFAEERLDAAAETLENALDS